MDIFDVKTGEKLTYIFLIVIPVLIGIVAVLLSFSADDGIDPKMLVAMFVCFSISLYFAMQYKMHEDGKKKAEKLSADLKKELNATNIPETTVDESQNNSTIKKNTKK